MGSTSGGGSSRLAKASRAATALTTASAATASTTLRRWFGSGGALAASGLGACERDEEGVALVVDLSSAVSGEGLAQQAVVVGQNARVVGAVGSEKLRRALDVGDEERCRCGRRLDHVRHHVAPPSGLTTMP